MKYKAHLLSYPQLAPQTKNASLIQEKKNAPYNPGHQRACLGKNDIIGTSHGLLEKQASQNILLHGAGDFFFARFRILRFPNDITVS